MGSVFFVVRGSLSKYYDIHNFIWFSENPSYYTWERYEYFTQQFSLYDVNNAAVDTCFVDDTIIPYETIQFLKISLLLPVTNVPHHSAIL